MTKVLLITNKADITTDFIVRRLQERKISYYRFNTEELTRSIDIFININLGVYSLYDRNQSAEIDLREFTAVYFRRPDYPTDITSLTEAENNFIRNEIASVLEGVYKILRKAYWVSDIQSIREAENKIYQLELAKALGFTIPQSLITNSFKHAKDFYNLYNSTVVKPIKRGLVKSGNEEKLIFTSKIESFPSNNDQIESCPHFLQTEISKKADLRITLVGSKEFTAMIHSQETSETITDWRKSDKPLKHTPFVLPNEIRNKCIALVKVLNLRFGAIDMILDTHDNFHFLEINPNGQWAWIENELNYNISGELVTLLCDESF